MVPLWKIRSGEFAGWRDRDLLYDSDGENVGFYDGEVAFSIRGDYIGELYDEQTIGKRRSIGHGRRGVRARHARSELALDPKVDIPMFSTLVDRSHCQTSYLWPMYGHRPLATQDSTIITAYQVDCYERSPIC